MTKVSTFVPIIPTPPVRRLRVYAFDPQSSVELATAIINDAIIELPWETRWEDLLEPGPTNEYLQVVDIDPSSDLFYAPVDLNDPLVLAQDGLPPSEGRPQFHQQMVFAVAMQTIRNFERALGRLVFWAGDRKARNDAPERRFTKRLRIYPHALREANAYYSPAKRALLFGYFKDSTAKRGIDSWVFTCLSQDIIAHETTHAILHGAQQRSIEASNPDMLAFHEAFADIVALLQHFGLKEVVRHQLANSRGSLRENGLLTGLALQFGHATGRKGSLRYALDYLAEDESPTQQDATSRHPFVGTFEAEVQTTSPTTVDPCTPATFTGRLAVHPLADQNIKASQPPEEPPSLANVFEAHARGGFLVAAVFDAFVTIYEHRTSDLFRLVGKDIGTAGHLPAELIDRLASEAGKSADHVLRMCVRALDYVPPVDMHFGEYLRAIITADTDLVPNDPMRYRVAFVEAFKKRGIGVPGCISMAPDSLLWDEPDLVLNSGFSKRGENPQQVLSESFGELLKNLQLNVVANAATMREFGLAPNGSRFNLRDLAMKVVEKNQSLIHDWLQEETPLDEAWEVLLGMRLMSADDDRRTKGVTPIPSLWGGRANEEGAFPKMPKVEVHSARIAERAGPDGQELKTLVIILTQKRRGYDDVMDQEKADAGDTDTLMREPDFWFRGGATLHVDLRDGKLIRVIRKRVDNEERLKKQRHYRSGDVTGQAIGLCGPAQQEPFAFIHRSDK